MSSNLAESDAVQKAHTDEVPATSHIDRATLVLLPFVVGRVRSDPKQLIICFLIYLAIFL